MTDKATEAKELFDRFFSSENKKAMAEAYLSLVGLGEPSPLIAAIVAEWLDKQKVIDN